jgi:hypothetical protein
VLHAVSRLARPIRRRGLEARCKAGKQGNQEMQISLSDAIRQLRDELRVAILEAEDQDIVFTPNGIDIELGVGFSAEVKAGGGFKLLVFLDLSTETKVGQESQHKIKLSLAVADRNGKPIKVRSDSVPEGLPK